jgi:pimeloyl-ACP methyl ester carboxylesterase
MRRPGRPPAPDGSVRAVLIEGPWRHREVTANGIRFHLATGQGFTRDRPLVLLLHGFGEFWWAWRHQLPALDAAGLSVAALDLRGYGATDKTPRGYRQSVAGLDVSAVIRSLGFSSAYVVGHDWGGVAAWSTYAYAPEQVTGLATIAAPHPLALPWRSMGPGLLWFQLPILPERVIMARDGAYVEWLLRHRAATGSGFLSASEARHYRQALRLWPSPHCALEYLRMFGRDQLRAAGRDYRRALATPVRVPLLTIRGSADRLLTARSMLPPGPYAPSDHRHVEVPGSGHLPHEEAPDAVSAALLDWLPH